MPIDPAAPIKGRKSWGDHFLLTIESPDIARRSSPGQFVMVRVGEGPWPLLRRPLSIHGRRGKQIELFFKVAGAGTALLARKEEGEKLDLIGPLGKGFNLEAASARGKIALAVGGGRGIAPLYFLAQEMKKRGKTLKVLYGGKSRQEIPLREKFKKAGFDIACSTDDGSFGHKGFVSELLKKELEALGPASVSAVFACGPDPMLKAVAEMASAAGIPAQLSLEARMGCGFGACWGCVVRIRKNGQEEWVKTCEEGPVFGSNEVVWPEGT